MADNARVQPCQRDHALARLTQAESFVAVAELVVGSDDHERHVSVWCLDCDGWSAERGTWREARNALDAHHQEQHPAS
jgi:hypothetical protein